MLWKLPTFSTNALHRSFPCNAATSACQTCKCSTQSCMSPSKAASGGGCRLDLATGTGLHPDEPVVEERGARPSIRISAARADCAYQARSGFDGQHHRQGPSRWYGCVKKNGPQSIGKSRGGWTTKIHMVAADARTAITFSLSPGQAHDAPEGRRLLNQLGPQRQNRFLLMDRAYQGNETRQLALALGFTPVVPPLSTRVDPWEYDREMYKRRNEIEGCSAG